MLDAIDEKGGASLKDLKRFGAVAVQMERGPHHVGRRLHFDAQPVQRRQQPHEPFFGNGVGQNTAGHGYSLLRFFNQSLSVMGISVKGRNNERPESQSDWASDDTSDQGGAFPPSHRSLASGRTRTSLRRASDHGGALRCAGDVKRAWPPCSSG